MYYCTLDEAKDELKASGTIDDNKLLRYIRQVSRRIDRIMGNRAGRPYFAPYLEDRKFRMDGRHIDSYRNTLLLRGAPPLLSITSVTADGTDVSGAVEGYPQGDPFFHRIRITSSGDPWASYISSDDPPYAVVTGVWGYHSDYASAWLAVDTLAAQQAAGASSLTVANVDGADPYGIIPRISAGALLKLNDEFELVTATNTTTNVVSTTREQQGTSAAVHALAAPVAVFQVEDPIKRVTARQAAMMYARIGAFQVETVDGVGAVSYPQDLLHELAVTLTEYQYDYL